MAYGRRYWRRYYRRYYRGKYNSYGKMRMSRNFKASASNMTQGGTFNVSAHKEVNLDLPAPQTGTTSTFNYDKLDIPAIIASSDMHAYLSNVFDQYRVDRLAIRIRAVGNDDTGIVNPSMLFSAVDRTDFANNLPLSTIRTYGSYRESQISGAKDISPTHTVYISQSNLVEWSTYTDTKNRVSFPCVLYGVAFASATQAITVSVSIEIDAQIRYRGVRLDTRQVSQLNKLPFQVNPNDQPSLNELIIDKASIIERSTTSGNLYPRTATKVTQDPFYLAALDFIIAIKVSGNNAGKEVRGAFVTEGTGVVEFSNNTEYNVYRGSTTGTVGLIDMFAKLSFIDSTMTINVGLPEVPEGRLPTSIEDFPIVYSLQ